jgi:uncharacterized protein (TIGR03086 family)
LSGAPWSEPGSTGVRCLEQLDGGRHMNDTIEAYRRAVSEFGARVRAVESDQWKLPTPCTDWDVRDLVGHLVNEERWAAPLLAGSTIEEVGDRFEGDLLGDDPPAAWEDAAAEATAAAEQDVLGRTVHVSFGDITGEEYLCQLTTDHVIHAWDLARAIGGDERLDPELVDFVFRYLEPKAGQWRQMGAFGPAVEAPSGGDQQTRMLAIAGRRA